MSAHPQHPNCESCGKALFKSAYKAKVKPSDPYAYCRNRACPDWTFRAVVGEVGKSPAPEQVAAGLPLRSLVKGKPARTGSKTEAVKAAAKATGNVMPIAPKAPKPAGKALVDAAAKADRERAAKTVMAPSKPVAQPATPKPDTKPVSKRGVKRAAVPSSEAKRKPKEAEPLAQARERIRGLIGDVAAGAPRQSVGLVLALLSQETGSQAAANALIDEFDLASKYGLQKFEPPPAT